MISDSSGWTAPHAVQLSPETGDQHHGRTSPPGAVEVHRVAVDVDHLPRRREKLGVPRAGDGLVDRAGDGQQDEEPDAAQEQPHHPAQDLPHGVSLGSRTMNGSRSKAGR